MWTGTRQTLEGKLNAFFQTYPDGFTATTVSVYDSELTKRLAKLMIKVEELPSTIGNAISFIVENLKVRIKLTQSG